MYTPGDIQNAAGRIYNERAELRGRENGFKGELGSISGWWQGGACKSFVQGCTEMGYETGRIYSDINELELGLKRLAREVQRADEERRRREAEKRLMQQAKTQKR